MNLRKESSKVREIFIKSTFFLKQEGNTPWR